MCEGHAPPAPRLKAPPHRTGLQDKCDFLPQPSGLATSPTGWCSRPASSGRRTNRTWSGRRTEAGSGQRCTAAARTTSQARANWLTPSSRAMWRRTRSNCPSRLIESGSDQSRAGRPRSGDNARVEELTPTERGTPEQGHLALDWNRGRPFPAQGHNEPTRTEGARSRLWTALSAVPAGSLLPILR